jgi:hypothetical protein
MNRDAANLAVHATGEGHAYYASIRLGESDMTTIASVCGIRAAGVSPRAAKARCLPPATAAAIEPLTARANSSKRVNQPTTGRALLLPALLAALLLFSTACHDYSFASDGEGQYAWSYGPRRILVKALGEIEFTPDDADVARLSSDGYLMIEESMAWDSKILEFSLGADGKVHKRLLVEGKEQPFDGQSLAWMRRLLPEVIRHTGLSAETRARRILEGGGYRALAGELEHIERSSAAARYVEVAFASNLLSEGDRADLLGDLAGYVHSDSRRTDLLRRLSAQAASEPLRGPYFDAVDSIGSNSNRTQLLSEVWSASSKDPETARRLLESVGRIGSDSNKAQLLMQAAADLPAQPAVRESFFAAAGMIGSDSNKTSVLRALLPRAEQDPELVAPLLEASHTIGSDSNKASLLTEAARFAGATAKIREAFFTAAETIGSNSNRTQVLSAVLDSGQIDAPTLARLYRAGTSMGSDSNKADVLIRSVPSYREDPGVRQAFFTMAGAIGSSSNRANAFASLLERPSLDAETVLAMLESTESIASDSNKADVLARVAQRRDSDPRIPERLQKAARTLGSDSAYRRVMSEMQPEAGRSRGEI